MKKPPARRPVGDFPVWSSWLSSLKRFLKKEPGHPDDPYAMVGAPKKPKPPHRRSAIAVEPDR